MRTREAATSKDLCLSWKRRWRKSNHPKSREGRERVDTAAGQGVTEQERNVHRCP